MDAFQDFPQLDPTANKTKALHRNKACLTCRTRKTKCDATKPVCSSCQRLGPRYHSQCQYDQPPKWLESVVKNNRLKLNDEQTKIIELELKLQRLHHKLINLQSSHHRPSLIPHHHFSSPSPSTTSSLPELPTSSPPPPIFPSTQSSSTDSFLLVSEPNWLSHLPPRKTCKTLIKAFFNRPLSPFTLVEPVGLQSRIDLSCSDPNFPEPALIHAICAIGSQYLAVQDLFPAYWSPVSNPPHLHHARWAERLLNNGILSDHHQKFYPTKLIQLSEAAVLCCQYYTLVGKPLMIWKSLGYSIRLATLLGLNYPTPHYPTQSHTLPGSSNLENDLVSLWPDGVGLLEDPPNHHIQHYRTILWWYVFCCDKMCAAAGGFASTMDEKDSLIPIYNPPPMPTWSSTSVMGREEINLMMSSDQIFINSVPDPTSLYLPKSPGFFFYHQVGLFDSLQLLIKAAILLGRVNTSLYRRSHPAKSSDQINQEYEELSNLVWGLFNSIPECLKNPFRLNQSGHLDSCLLSAHTLIHTALIQINEDLVEINSKDDGEEEEHLKICKESGKVLIEWFLELIKWKNLGLIQVDLGHLLCGNPALNFALSVALRTHCRFIAICKLGKSFDKNLAYLDHLTFQINFILAHLKKSQKMPLEGRIVELINSLLNSPWALLPKNKKNKTCLPHTQYTTNLQQQQTDSKSTEYYNNSNPNPNKKTGISIYLHDACKSQDDSSFHSMVSNFALAKLLDSQI